MLNHDSSQFSPRRSASEELHARHGGGTKTEGVPVCRNEGGKVDRKIKLTTKVPTAINTHGAELSPCHTAYVGARAASRRSADQIHRLEAAVRETHLVRCLVLKLCQKLRLYGNL